MANKSLNAAASQLTILVPGGAGFIGSHTVVELLEQGYNVVIVDDLPNSSAIAVDRIREITGCPEEQLTFYEENILDRAAMERVFQSHSIDAIIMFAGYNDLVTTHPEVAAIWHPRMNKRLKPTDVQAKSNKLVWWHDVCGHTYQMSVRNRVKARPGYCPYCSGRKKAERPIKLD